MGIFETIMAIPIIETIIDAPLILVFHGIENVASRPIGTKVTLTFIA